MRLNSPYSKRSPGRPRDVNPAAFIAAENTSPDAPASKRAIEIEERGALRLGHGTMRLVRDIRKTGEAPPGERGFST